MDELLLSQVFRSMQSRLPLPPHAMQSDKNIASRKLLALMEDLNKSKKSVFGEVVDQIKNNIYWKNINIIDIEPEDISFTVALLRSWVGQMEKLICALVTSESKIIHKYREYILQHIQNPIIVKTYLQKSNIYDISSFIAEIREKHNPSNLFFFSAFSQQMRTIIRNLYENATHKDYILLVAATYETHIINSLKRKITMALKGRFLPSAWSYFLLDPNDGEWDVLYNEPYLEINFELKKSRELHFAKEVVKYEQGSSLCLSRYYFPPEDKLFAFLQELGFTAIYTCKEEKSAINIMLCQKSKLRMEQDY